MNSAQWHQEIVVNNPVEELIPSSNITSISKTNNNLGSSVGSAEKNSAGTVVRPPKEQPIPCPRCNSINTKFCYYNNYSLTQPRYFCKGCRRYWTEGGSLRNIPVGGGSRKQKRSPISAVTAPSGDPEAKKLFGHPSFPTPNNNTMIHHHQPERASHDLNLSFPTHHQDDYRSISDFVHMPTTSSQTAATGTGSSHFSALELLTGMTSRGSVGLGLGGGFSNTFIPIFEPDSAYSSATFSNFMHNFKPPTLNFSLNNNIEIAQSNRGGGFGTTEHNDQISSTFGSSGGGLLPYGGMKNQQQADDHHHQHQTEESRGHGMSTGFCTGMLGGGGGSNW